MDAVMLTWRPANIITIIVMVVGLFLVIALGTQVYRAITGASDAD